MDPTRTGEAALIKLVRKSVERRLESNDLETAVKLSADSLGMDPGRVLRLWVEANLSYEQERMLAYLQKDNGDYVLASPLEPIRQEFELERSSILARFPAHTWAIRPDGGLIPLPH